MVDSLRSILVYGNGIAFTGYVLFALFVLKQQHRSGVPRQLQHQFLTGMAALSAIWAMLVALFGWFQSASFLQASQLADVFRYGAWHLSLLSILLVGRTKKLKVDKDALWLFFLSVSITLVSLLVQYLFPIVIEAGWYAPKLALIDGLMMPVWTLFLLEQLMRNVAKDSQWNLKPLALGLAGACVFDIYLYAQALMFGRLDLTSFSVRGVVHALMLPLIAFAVIRSRDWVRRIKVSRKIVLHTTMVVLVGGGLLIMAAFGYLVRFIGGNWGEAFRLVALFALILVFSVLLFSGATRSRIRVWVDKHFFRYRYDYRDEWLKFTRALSLQTSPEGLAEQIVRELAAMVESPAGCLWIREQNERHFRQLVAWNMPVLAEKESQDSSLCTFLKQTGWVVRLDEYRREPDLYDGIALPDWLPGLKEAWLVVPLSIGRELIGYVILANSRTPFDVNWEVLDLLKTAGSQAAGHLNQLLIMEALLETRKFEAFNRMSAFVVHDLKNIIAQLSLMLNNAAKHRDNPEFQQDMLETVEHALGKMKKLMAQLQEGGVKQTMNLGVNLKMLFEQIKNEKSKAGRDIECSIEGNILVRGDDERMVRVFGHLVQNALDATAANRGRVLVKAMTVSNKANIEIEDTGCGMTEDFVRERLFKPFETTKTIGMGIGAYESYQYFKGLGGEVSVRSKIDEGTTFSVLLPLFQPGGVH